MKRTTAALALLLVLSIGAFAAPPQATTGTMTKKKKAHPKPSAPAVADQLKMMQDGIDAQQKQIQQLTQQIESRDAVIQQLQQQMNQVQGAASQAQQKADMAASQSTQQQQDVAAVRSDVSDLKVNATNTALSLQETQKNMKDSLESPLALHYKGITITPGGFLAAETVWRRAATGSDINTPFNSIPFPGSSQNDLSEFFASGRQSRVSMLAEGKLSNAKLTGYVEADFLSAGVTSNNNQSNSYTLRQRQAWGQAALSNGWSFTGGQMWSLVTETKNGVDNRTEVLPMVIDPQYNVGFSWARQYGFRVAKNFGNKFWMAFSAENAQTTVGGEGATTGNFLIGSAGTSGGLYNPASTYSFNKLPDFIAKAVFQPNKTTHIEVFGLVSEFRDRLFPNATATTPSAAGARNNSGTGAGLGANLRSDLFNKHVDVGIHFLGGNGVGRYGTSGLADVLVRPDGVLVPIRSYQALGTLEYHAKKLDIYSNVGGEYAGRDSLSASKAIGYGSPFRSASGCYIETLPGTPASASGSTTPAFPVSSNGFLPGGLGSCNVDTRDILEGTIGFWYRFYNGPKGRIQWGPQFSYIVRNGWTGVGGNPSATEPIILTSFRYYLP